MKKTISAAMLCVGLISGGCTESENNSEILQTPQISQNNIEMDNALADGINIFSRFVYSGPLKLLVAKETCIVWESNLGEYSIVKDPILLNVNTPQYKLEMIPFVSGPGTFNVGSYNYLPKDEGASDKQLSDTLKNNSIKKDAFLLTDIGSVVVAFNSEMGGWIEDENGQKVNHSVVTNAQDYPVVVDQLCGKDPYSPEQIPQLN